jgi:flavin reductase (DIM6/NTAB) family NADH-FMN oxidoreductase RutF
MPTDAEFRDAMGHFATGVTVVTSIDDDGKPVGTSRGGRGGRRR